MSRIRAAATVRERTPRAGGAEEMRYAAIYERTDTGYSAYAPDLPGCIAAGRSPRETEKLMREAIDLHLRAMREDGDAIPEPTTVADYIISAA